MKPLYQCPKCSSLNLYVFVTVLARVDQSGDMLATVIDGGSTVSDAANDCHGWDNSHNMECLECGHCCGAAGFTVTRRL